MAEMAGKEDEVKILLIDAQMYLLVFKVVNCDVMRYIGECVGSYFGLVIV